MSTCIIAEAGVNHNGSLERALELIDAAARAGADVVKFQTFKTEKVISRNAEKAEYQKNATGSEESQFEMVKKLELDEVAHRLLMKRCTEKGITFLSTPFDSDSVRLLAETFELPRLKIPSGEITNAPMLFQIAAYGKPVILSTGMSTLGDVEAALGVLAFGYLKSAAKPSPESFQRAFYSDEGQSVLQQNVILLHCTTEYPAPFAEVNLRAMDTLRSAFRLPVGFSDHTEGIAIPLAAVARGAVIIEKHFTLDRKLPGPDHRASLQPDELTAMVRGIREVEQALGNPLKAPAPSERKNIAIARKSLVAGLDIKKGDLLNETNLAIKRPGTGISPMHYWEYLNLPAERDYREDEVIS